MRKTNGWPGGGWFDLRWASKPRREVPPSVRSLLLWGALWAPSARYIMRFGARGAPYKRASLPGNPVDGWVLLGGARGVILEEFGDRGDHKVLGLLGQFRIDREGDRLPRGALGLGEVADLVAE